LETISRIHCLNVEGGSLDAEDYPGPIEKWERRWIESAQRGDAASFERIVVAYQQKVFNLAYRLLGDREEAEDLTQEVFVNVFRHLSNFRGDSQFSTWIFQVTLNHCRNRFKYLKRRFHHATESIDDPLQSEEGEIGRDLPDEADMPEEMMYRRQVQRLVQVALGELREEYREMVALRDIQELSYQEIGEILGLPEGTIKSRLHRARLELKEILMRLGIRRGE
jgi:RNA polymerase sigma-70 factor, ECF subfamily